MFWKNQTGILNSAEICWLVFLVVFEKEDLVTLHEHYKNKQTNKQTKLIFALDVNQKRDVLLLAYNIS